MGAEKVQLVIGEDKVAVITINNPPVNSFDNFVFNGLYKSFEEVVGREDVEAVVIRGANGTFSAGMDIKTFQSRQNGEEDTERRILSSDVIFNNVIEGCRKPVVAAIEGFALGGGLELAMVCHARVASNGSKLGLPELQLGIIPGLGGTQRLPRLVGMDKALDMLLNSRSITAKEAKKYGLVDEICDSPNLLFVARKLALGLAHRKGTQCISLHRMDIIGSIDDSLNIIRKARTAAEKRFRNVRHPFACLDAIEEGLCKGAAAGIEMERKLSHSLIFSREAKSLMHIFFSKRSSFKVRGVTDLGFQPRHIEKVAIVGSGFMGSGIATALVIQNIPVLLKDLNLSCLEIGMDQIKGNLEILVRKGVLPKDQALRSLDLITTTVDYNSAFKNIDLVIESVVEDISVKKKVFKDLENVCSHDCTIASNTSSIDIGTIGEGISHPDRIAGTHFFSPAYVMPLFEIVRTEKTSTQVLVDMLQLAKRLNKVPVVVKSTLGFAVNRLFCPYLMVSTFLVDLGLDPYRLDSILKGFGMPMGPFRVADFTGINIYHAVSKLFHEKDPLHFYLSPLVDLLVNDNRLGDSTKKGFYDYHQSGKEVKDPQLDNYLEKSRQLKGWKSTNHVHIQTAADPDIIELVFFLLVNEACKLLEDGIVTEPSSLDISSVFGMGFPAYRGGIVFWADGIGLSYILDRLRQWCVFYGPIYEPCPLMERLVSSNTPLGRFSVRHSYL